MLPNLWALNGNDTARSYQVELKRHTLRYKAWCTRPPVAFKIDNPGFMKLFERTGQI